MTVVLQVFRLARFLFGCGTLVAVVYFGVTVPIRETAGQETVLTVAYNALVDVNAHLVVSYAAAALFGGLWWRERRTRIDAVARENRRNRALEMSIDPGRTSSGFEE